MTGHTFRLALATLCVFVALGAAIGVLHAMLFDGNRVFGFAVIALTAGVAGFVLSGTPSSPDAR